MPGIVFPSSPTLNQVYPPGSGAAGVSQWKWDGSKWNTVPVFVRTNNQLAYNEYVWPNTGAAEIGFQLTDKLANGDLTWDVPGGPFVYLDDISSQFNGTQNIFTLTEAGVPFVFAPAENIIVVLGGIIQTPGISYTLSGSQITFSSAPAPGAAFVGISNFSSL